MPTPVFLDAEVIQHDPPQWAVRGPEHFNAPKNYKDPQKIQEHIAKKVQEQVDDLRTRSSLCPDGPLLGGTIAAVGVAVGPAAPWVGTAATGDEAGELALLQLLEAGLTARPPADHVLITFGGDRYDLPFLGKRALRHGLYGLAGWVREVRHVDIRRIWEWGDRQALGRLTDIARWLGVAVEDTTRGSDVQALWESGRAGEVGAHCGSDVVVLREVWRRFAAAGWAPGDVGEAGEAAPAPAPAAPAPAPAPAAPAPAPAPAAPAPAPQPAAAPAVPARAALEAEVERLEATAGPDAVEESRRALDIGLRVPLGNIAEPDLLTRYRDALAAAAPAPLVAPSGIQSPGLPVLEDNMALYHRAVAAGWDPTPFARDGQLEDRWLAAALLHLGTRLRQAYSFWTGEPAPGFRSTRTWHEDLARRVYEARLACATGELAWVAPTPVPDEVDVTILVGEGASSYVLAGRGVAGPDVDRSAVQGRVLRQPGAAQQGAPAAPTAQPVPA
jgi:hypothetical protein